MGRALALDVGTKTIGVAMTDPERRLASPVRTLSRKSVAADTAALASFVAAEGVDVIVVGLPLELDGAEDRSARLARQVGTALAERTGVRVVYVDERFTSVDADRQLIEAGLSRDRRRRVIDQAAAVLILRSFLEHPELLHG
jgi:putative Holliday junction resolvase